MELRRGTGLTGARRPVPLCRGRPRPRTHGPGARGAGRIRATRPSEGVGSEPGRAGNDSSGRSPRRAPAGRRVRRARRPPFAARTGGKARARVLCDRRRRLSSHRRRCMRSALRRPLPADARAARAPARPARRASAGAAQAGDRARRARAPRARAAGGDEARAGALQVRAPARRRPRPGRLRGVGGAAAPRPDRHARRLVAAQAVVRLSVTQGVAPQARPRSAEASIAASVRR